MTKRFVLEGAESTRKLSVDYSNALNQEQRDAVLHGEGAALVLAGAGSGKTTTITYRVAYMIERGTPPSDILLLTFTNKASREMLERVERLLGSAVHGIWGGTFHSIANRLLRMNAERLGYTPGFTILDMEDAKGLLKAVLKDMHIDMTQRRFPSPAVCANILSYARNICGSIQETVELKHPSFRELISDLEELARRYDDRKQKTNSMDFDDLLQNLLRLLEMPDAGASISSRFRYVLVDEYQDTNAIQARIVNRFAHAHGNVFVVGDDAQSIYGFRGADVQNILCFPEEHAQVRVFKLVTNYRSTPEILHLANDSLRHNLDQFEKELVGVQLGGSKPAVIPCASAKQEAQYIAEQALRLREEGTALRNMAVLFRATSHSQQLELELLKRDIPYEYRGGLKFFERAHIKDIQAFLRVFQNPKDETAWRRVLVMQAGIGETLAGALSRQAMTHEHFSGALADRMDGIVTPRAASGWGEFLAIAGSMVTEAPTPSAMIRAVAASSYQQLLEREYPNWRDRLEDIEQFALFAEGYESLESFLADVSLYDDVLAKREEYGPNDDERMVLSTVHQSKGLEWDTVFILHLADGAFPNGRALAEENGIEEERRLFYVAVTRARRRLFLSYPLTMGHDSLVLNRPSQFLDEIDPRLTERIELVDAYRAKPPPDHGWNWDLSGSEDVIELDALGEPRASASSRTAWKASTKSANKPPRELLPPV